MDKGIFWVVATPIGNLGDFSPRAESCLREVSLVLAEDTRNSQQLLSHFGIQNRLLSCHEHNEADRLERVEKVLEAGEDVAIISDAGTPLISDPGFRLVAALRERAFTVQCIPGPSSVIAALSIAGVPTDRFTFFGFFPSKQGAFDKRVAELLAQRGTSVHFESSHRVRSTLARLSAMLPADAKGFVARELTKKFEDSVLLPVGDLIAWLDADAYRKKGEFVIVLSIPALADVSPDQARIDALVAAMRSEGLSTKTIVNVVTAVFSVNKKIIYQQVLSMDE